jgi:hypothetical protein
LRRQAPNPLEGLEMRILCSLSTLVRFAFWLAVAALLVGMVLAHHDVPQS